MAKKPVKKTRNILVRDLDKDTAKELDAYKQKYDIKADSKAVVQMIKKVDYYIGRVDSLGILLESKTDEATHYKEILEELRDAQSRLSNFEFNE